MALTQLTQTTSTYNLYTAAQKVLDHTPDSSNLRYCKIHLQVGDATNGLNSGGCTLSLEIKIGGISHDGGTQAKVVPSGQTQAVFISNELIVPASDDVEVYIQSSNMSDSNVRVIATLCDIPTGNVIEVSGDSTAANNLESYCDGSVKMQVNATQLNGAVPNNLSAADVNSQCDTALSDAGVNSSRMSLVDKLSVSGTLANTDNANNFKASGFATPGDAMTLTSAERSTLVNAIEVELANDGTGEQLMQAIADKLAAEFDIEELNIAAIATAVRDAILDRILAGNHDSAGTLGKLLQTAATQPANFADLAINGSGHIERVTLTDTTTTNSDMRGTDGVPTNPMLATEDGSSFSNIPDMATATNQAAIQVSVGTSIPALIDGLNDYDPSTEAVTLANGPHGGAAATLVLADYSDFQGSGAALSEEDITDIAIQTAAAIEIPEGGTSIWPVASTVSSGEVDSSPITAYQDATTPVTIYVKDAQKNPIDLTGRNLAFSISDDDRTVIAYYPAANIDIGVDGTNSALVAYDEAAVASRGRYNYTLWDVDAKQVLAEHFWNVKLTAPIGGT